MHKCYVRHASADDVAVFLREEQARGLMVLPPLPDSPWTAVVPLDDGALDGSAERLAERFGAALLVTADDAGWSLRLIGPARVEIRSTTVAKTEARKAAQSVSQPLGLPKITTALERALKRPLSGTVALDRLGEALDLAACGWTADQIAEDARVEKLRVEGSRVIGRINGAAAGAGYAHVGELIEDTIVELLRRGRTGPALRQLRGYDIVLSLQDGALRCQAPQGLMTDGLKRALGEHKEAILAALSQTPAS